MINHQIENNRIVQVDALRGFAVLGIYWINILIFALPYNTYTMPTLTGIADQANVISWAISEIYFDGTMRGLFSLLFGASAMLFLDETRLQQDGLNVVERYYRRTILLVLFGLIHAYILLWPYDVLYAYGLLGLFLFPLRKLSSALLVVLSCTILFFGSIENPYQLEDDQTDMEESHASIRDTMNALQNTKQAPLVNPDAQTNNNLLNDEDIELYRSDYKTIFIEQLKVVIDQQSIEMYSTHFFDIGGMMLMGMALFRLGILSGRRSKRFYLILMVSGYAFGLFIRGIIVYISILNDFNGMLVSKDIDLNYDLGRLPVTLGHVGLIGLLCQYSWFDWIKSRFAAVGRMALTNYIMQTIISLLIFYGFGLALYATFERYELVFLCLAVWLVQIIFSVAWLNYFSMGPLEWVWRSMIYGQLQAFRKK